MKNNKKIQKFSKNSRFYNKNNSQKNKYPYAKYTITDEVTGEIKPVQGNCPKCDLGLINMITGECPDCGFSIKGLTVNEFGTWSKRD